MDQNEEALNSINSDLIRGHIDTIILKALQAGDRYGYDIIKEIEHKSDGQYIIKQPTLYSCLKRLEVQGFVKSYWGSKSIGGRKKYFTLTDMGRELFVRNKNDWDYSRTVIDKLISDDNYVTYTRAPQLSGEQRTITYEQDAVEQDASNLPAEEDDEEVDESTFLTVEPLELSDEDDETAEYVNAQPDLADEDDEEIQIADIPIMENTDDEDEPVCDEEENPDEADDDSLQEELINLDTFENNYDEDDEDETDISDVTVWTAENEPDDEESEEPNDVLQPIDEDDEDDEDETDISDVTVWTAENEPDDEESEETDDVLPPIDDDDEDIYDALPDEEEDELLYDDDDELDEEENIAAAEEPLPLSAAEQNSAEGPTAVEDDGLELINKVYNEHKQESYFGNADSTSYEPDQNDSVIDASNYFEDIYDYDEYVDEEAATAAEAIAPPAETKDEAPEEVQPQKPEIPVRKFVREKQPENKTVFYSYDRTGVSSIDDSATIIDKEYRFVINKLISDNVIVSEPRDKVAKVPARNYENAWGQPSAPVKQEESEKPATDKIELDTGDHVQLRTYSDKTVKAYNSKHFYYCNQLRLLQYGILFGIMIVEIIMCFYFIEVSHNHMNITNASLATYIVAVVVAALFPIIAFFMASNDYHKRKRINYSGKSSAFFSIIVTLLLSLIAFFCNIYGGLLSGDINNYLSTLILPIILSTNVITNAIIFHLLYTSGKYNIEE